MKSILFLLVLSIFACSLTRLDRFFFKHNGSFCLRHIHTTIPTEKSWEIPNLEKEEAKTVREILSQKFHYFAKGKQSFVFLSEDQKYVLKFHRVHTTLRPLPWLNHPLNSLLKTRKSKKIQTNFAHLEETFNSFKDAYLHLKEESAVVFIHLNPSSHLNQKLHIIDTYGTAYELSADKLPFVLQKKGTLFISTLQRSLDQQDFASVKNLIKETIQLFVACAQKGYDDVDASLEKNYGVIDTHPFILDFGRLHQIDQPMDLKQFVIGKTGSLKQKILFYPPLAEYYYQIIHEIP